MLSKKDLEYSINKLERTEPTYEVCARLADLYIIRDHMPTYSERLTGGKSEFMRSINGKDAESVMKIMDELMEATQVLNPKLYENVLLRVNDL